MTFDEAKGAQIDQFKKGTYMLIKKSNVFENRYYLEPNFRANVEQQLMQHAADLLRMPTKLRVIPGGKSR